MTMFWGVSSNQPNVSVKASSRDIFYLPEISQQVVTPSGLGRFPGVPISGEISGLKKNNRTPVPGSGTPCCRRRRRRKPPRGSGRRSGSGRGAARWGTSGPGRRAAGRGGAVDVRGWIRRLFRTRGVSIRDPLPKGDRGYPPRGRPDPPPPVRSVEGLLLLPLLLLAVVWGVQMLAVEVAVIRAVIGAVVVVAELHRLGGVEEERKKRGSGVGFAVGITLTMVNLNWGSLKCGFCWRLICIHYLMFSLVYLEAFE